MLRSRVQLALLAVFATLALTAGYFFYSRTVDSLREEISATYGAVVETETPCTAGSKTVVERWSKIGWSRSCRRGEVRHGPWEAWENQRIVIRGAYDQDQKDGRWVWLSADGHLVRTIEYERGTVVRDTGESEGSAKPPG